MRNVISTLGLAVSIATLSSDFGVAQQATAEADVKAVNARFYEAASAGDVDKMASVWAHEPYVRAIHPNLPIDEGWEAVRAGWRGVFERFPQIAVNMPEPHIRVGDSVAWVTGEEDFKGRSAAGEEVSATLLGTNVYERSGDEWLMVHHHVSFLPPP